MTLMTRPVRVWLSAALFGAVCASGCGAGAPQQPPVATPAFSTSQSRLPLGSPVEVSYKFTVAADAPALGEDYRVFVHFLDSDHELMWTDDHDPPVPTSQWKPGQVIDYQRTMFVPIYPYLGATTVEMGLYIANSDRRLTLNGDDAGMQSYRVGKLELLPQTENVYIIFKDGWHPVETPPDNAAVEWQWTKKDATLSVRNPKRDVTFYLHLDQPGIVPEPQQVTVTLGDQTIDTFSIKPKDELIRKAPISAAQLGNGDLVDLHISVDKTFVPALVTNGASADSRELGVRIFHAFVQPH